MTSREYAQALKEMADYLDSKDEFQIGVYSIPFLLVNYGTKETFLAAVRALKPGTKEITEAKYGSDSEVRFTPVLPSHDFRIRVDVPRDQVCRLIAPAKWDCEPFLSDQEFESISEGRPVDPSAMG